MKKIDNEFQDYYFLNQDGSVYNSKTDKIIKADKDHMFALKTVDNKYKRIALKTLYKLVYDENFCIDRIEDLEGQKWKVIDSKASGYLVSNKGRIKSQHGYNAYLLKPYPNPKGYFRVDVIINKKRYCKLVHRLVASAFLPKPDDIDMQLHHIDFDKSNNCVENLQWLNVSDHRKKHDERKKYVSTKSEKNIH